jgi:hypothetical protein
MNELRVVRSHTLQPREFREGVCDDADYLC